MSRLLKIQFPGAVHHALEGTRQPTFADDSVLEARMALRGVSETDLRR
jgi:hypothetical protein